MQVIQPERRIIKPRAQDARGQRAQIANDLRTKKRNIKRLEVGPRSAWGAAGSRVMQVVMANYLGTKIWDTIHSGFTPIIMTASLDTPVATGAGNWYYAGGTTPASAILLNPIHQNGTTTSRLGKTVKMKAVALKGNIQASAVAATASFGLQQVAMALVYVKEVKNAAALPPHNDVFQSQNALTFTNPDNTTQYRILKKWNYNLAGDRDLAGDRPANSSIFFDEYIKLNGLETTWSGTSTFGGYDSMETGGLILYVRGMQNAATSSQAVMVVGRLYFEDA